MTFTPSQAADTLTQVGELAGRLAILEPRLRQAARGTPLDGYPRSSMGGVHGHGGDPTGTVAALRVDHPGIDTLAQSHHRVLGLVDHARRLLEEAESTAHQALPPVVSQGLDDGCTSCARIKAWSPVHRTRRCRWCYRWAGDHAGDDPPIDILRAHHDGRKINVRLAESILRRRHS